MSSRQGRLVLVKYMRYVFAGMKSIMRKYENVPDLSTIHDSLKAMQVKAKAASEETARRYRRSKR